MDKEWIPIGERNTVYFAELHPGDYTFERVLDQGERRTDLMSDIDEEIDLGLIQFLLFLIFEQLHVVGHCPFGFPAPRPEEADDDG